MIKIFLYLLSFILPASLSAQEINIRNIPLSETFSTQSLATFIRANYKTDKERFYAIHHWVARNIKYSKETLYELKHDSDNDTRIAEALKQRKGVCENFAAIFNDIAGKCGLTSFIVDGYTKQGGRLDRSGHNWCAVLLDNEWFLCDTTWDKDAQSDYKYFLADPLNIIETHMPFDPMWQLLNFPIKHNEFIGTALPDKKNDYFNFKDSIKAYNQLSYLEKLKTTVKRIGVIPVHNDLLKNQMAYLEMKISIVYEDQDMNLYNSAVNDFNIAIKAFNNFALLHNDPSAATTPLSSLLKLLNEASTATLSANQKIEDIGKNMINPQYDPSVLQNRLEFLNREVKKYTAILKSVPSKEPGSSKIFNE